MGSRKSANKLTKTELDFASSPDYPLLKQKIFRKLQVLMAETGNMLQNQDDNFIQKIREKAYYKISKGENLDGLPYLVLDYPRISGQDFPVLLRILFWWGKAVSLSLVIRTDMIDIEATAAKLAGLPKLRILNDTGLWEHDTDSAHYSKTDKLDAAEICIIMAGKEHLKLAKKYKNNKVERLEQLASGFLSLMETVIVRA